MSDFASASTERQSKAFLAVKAARMVLTDALSELAVAENARLRPTEPLTVVIDGRAVTSHKVSPDKWQYTVSRVIA